MSVDYSSTLQTDRMNKVATALDMGSTAGFLKFLTSTGGILSTITLGYPAASVSGAVLTLAGLPRSDSAAAGNASNSTPSECRLFTSTGGTVISGLTIGTATTNDVVMASTAIVPNQVVTVTSFTITHST